MPFHIGKDGKPRICKAQPGNCPRGGDHYDTIEDAQVGIAVKKLAGIFAAAPTPILAAVVRNNYYKKTIPDLADGAIPFLDAVKALINSDGPEGPRADEVEKGRELLEAFLEEFDPNETVKTADFTWSEFEREIADATAKRNELLEHGTKEELEAFLEERVNSHRFQEALALQDVMEDEARILYRLYDLEDKLYRLGDDSEDGSYDEVRQRGLDALYRWDGQLIMKELANKYKDVHSPIVVRLSELEKAEQIAAGTYREFNAEELDRADGSGALVAVGDFPSGSREWLESRQTGIGGSDVGKILKVGEADYREDEYLEVLSSKVDPITDEQVAMQLAGHGDGGEYSGYTGRGNAWEEYVVSKFDKNNPDLGVTHCKTSWQDKDFPFVRANFDGLLTDENGKPNGILEIKTSSKPENWGSEADGIDGVPAQYRKQALWYARAAGFERGAFGVMINDREYREYHFDMTPELKAEAQDDFEKVSKFWKEVEMRKNGTWKDSTSDFAKGFADSNLISLGREGNKQRNNTLKQLAAWRDEPLSVVKAEFDYRTQHIPLSRAGVNFDKEALPDVRRVIDDMFKEVDRTNPKTRPFVNIDLETSGSQPARGRIIDVGINIAHPSQEVSDKPATEQPHLKDHDKLYGIPEKVLSAAGTGRVDIHHIHPGQVSKQRLFHNEEEQKEVLGLLKEGTMVAHNALFETRWLRLHLKGFAEAEKRGDIKVFDTMYAARWFVAPQEKRGKLRNNNRLESFAEVFDIPYENAHRAKPDADMMGLAVNRFAKNLPNLPMLEPQARTSPAERAENNNILNGVAA